MCKLRLEHQGEGSKVAETSLWNQIVVDLYKKFRGDCKVRAWSKMTVNCDLISTSMRRCKFVKIFYQLQRN